MNPDCPDRYRSIAKAKPEAQPKTTKRATCTNGSVSQANDDTLSAKLDSRSLATTACRQHRCWARTDRTAEESSQLSDAQGRSSERASGNSRRCTKRQTREPRQRWRSKRRGRPRRRTCSEEAGSSARRRLREGRKDVSSERPSKATSEITHISPSE